jgi:probable F420-dependent oxidoreductase
MALDLGTVGIWSGALDALPVVQAQEAVAELDELGYGALWFGEAYGREAFTAAQLYLAASPRMVVATGIATIYGRDAVNANAAARTLSAAFPDRFLLGPGVSHAPLVERTRGHSYGRPLAAMREYLDAMDAAPYVVADGGEPPPRVLAALGPRMLELARERAQGAHPYLVTPAHTATARDVLGAGPLLAVEQAVVLTKDRDAFLAAAHSHLEIYTGLPNYRASWVREGFEETDFVRGGSERLKDALVVMGDEDDVVRRVREHLGAGATHVCLQVLGAHAFEVARDDWRRLAPAVSTL